MILTNLKKLNDNNIKDASLIYQIKRQTDRHRQRLKDRQRQRLTDRQTDKYWQIDRQREEINYKLENKIGNIF